MLYTTIDTRSIPYDLFLVVFGDIYDRFLELFAPCQNHTNSSVRIQEEGSSYSLLIYIL